MKVFPLTGPPGTGRRLPVRTMKPPPEPLPFCRGKPPGPLPFQLLTIPSLMNSRKISMWIFPIFPRESASTRLALKAVSWMMKAHPRPEAMKFRSIPGLLKIRGIPVSPHFPTGIMWWSGSPTSRMARKKESMPRFSMHPEIPRETNSRLIPIFSPSRQILQSLHLITGGSW